MNRLWLVINLLFIIPAGISGDFTDLIFTLGNDSHLGAVGAITVLVTPFAMEITKKLQSQTYVVRFAIFLNFVSMIYSIDLLLTYLKPSENSMWLLAILVPLVWGICASRNLFLLMREHHSASRS